LKRHGIKDAGGMVAASMSRSVRPWKFLQFGSFYNMVILPDDRTKENRLLQFF